MSIRAGPGLERVTTSSLEALRRFSEGNRAENRRELERAVRLFEEAVELDPEFAMAWRRLAVVLSNQGLDRRRMVEAASRARELRDRLSDRERHMAEGFYHQAVSEDRGAAIEAYERLLELNPYHDAALNNLSLLYSSVQRYDAALELLERATELPGAPAVAFTNLVEYRGRAGDLAGSRQALGLLAERHPDYPDEHLWFVQLVLEGDESGARNLFETTLDDPDVSPDLRSFMHFGLAALALRQGRIADAREAAAAAETAAAEVGPGFLWAFRLASAADEVLLGDPDRGAALIVEGWDEGMAETLPPEDRRHMSQANLLAKSGRTEEADSVLRAWEREVPPEYRGKRDRAGADLVRALIHLHEGRSHEAVEILEEVRTALSCPTCEAWAMGWALREAGRLEEAASEWEWSSLSGGARSEWIPAAVILTLPVWSAQRLAPLYEELGDVERALAHHRRLVDFWENADPELAPRVEHARERIRVLEGG